MFDLDGVLVDSESVWAEIEEKVVRDLGFDWDPAIHTLLHGTGPWESASILSAFLASRSGAQVETEVVAELMARHSRELFADGVPPAPGATELVQALRGRVPLGVATNSRREVAHRTLGKLADDIDTIVTADDVAAAKPAPDPYRLACERLGAPPRSSVAIEDSIPGMRSAKAAGLWLIACVPPVDAALAAEASAIADVLVDEIVAIDASALLGGVARDAIA